MHPYFIILLSLIASATLITFSVRKTLNVFLHHKNNLVLVGLFCFLIFYYFRITSIWRLSDIPLSGNSFKYEIEKYFLTEIFLTDLCPLIQFTMAVYMIFPQLRKNHKMNIAFSSWGFIGGITSIMSWVISNEINPTVYTLFYNAKIYSFRQFMDNTTFGGHFLQIIMSLILFAHAKKVSNDDYWRSILVITCVILWSLIVGGVILNLNHYTTGTMDGDWEVGGPYHQIQNLLRTPIWLTRSLFYLIFCSFNICWIFMLKQIQQLGSHKKTILLIKRKMKKTFCFFKKKSNLN